ncbi:hypothetical protein F511_09017 [Dorcoceras hygrometricum]|uniref:Uncharacterized protein n=1 Tax=Dorcoceras hygrometricum TaxID=472368 RepID=A0A2Z7BSY5_9LAMI|nr:hypothetical protein F511_09017 [Dorcoceras hygrometricum]
MASGTTSVIGHWKVESASPGCLQPQITGQRTTEVCLTKSLRCLSQAVCESKREKSIRCSRRRSLTGEIFSMIFGEIFRDLRRSCCLKKERRVQGGLFLGRRDMVLGRRSQTGSWSGLERAARSSDSRGGYGGHQIPSMILSQTCHYSVSNT